MEKQWSLDSWKLTLSQTVSELASIIQTSLTMCLRCYFLIKTHVARIYLSHNYYRTSDVSVPMNTDSNNIVECINVLST